MTSMAALMGTLPIALGFGTGAEARRPLGLAVVGGLVFSQLLTLYITPVLYIYMESFQDCWAGSGSQLPERVATHLDGSSHHSSTVSATRKGADSALAETKSSVSIVKSGLGLS